MNPFYGIMPDWFRIIGIVIATAAAIIASQALYQDHLHLSAKQCAKPLAKIPNTVSIGRKRPGILFHLSTMLFSWVVLLLYYIFNVLQKWKLHMAVAITLCMIATSILFANYCSTAQEKINPDSISTCLCILLLKEVFYC
jgi:KUP system potassium uptake protein